MLFTNRGVSCAIQLGDANGKLSVLHCLTELLPHWSQSLAMATPKTYSYMSHMQSAYQIDINIILPRSKEFHKGKTVLHCGSKCLGCQVYNRRQWRWWFFILKHSSLHLLIQRSHDLQYRNLATKYILCKQ